MDIILSFVDDVAVATGMPSCERSMPLLALEVLGPTAKELLRELGVR